MKNTQRVSYVVLCSMLLFEGVLPVSSYMTPRAFAADDTLASETQTVVTDSTPAPEAPQAEAVNVEVASGTTATSETSATSETGATNSEIVTENSGAVFQHTEDFQNQIVSSLNTPLVDNEAELPSQKQTPQFSLADLADLVVVESGLGTIHFSGIDNSETGTFIAQIQNKLAEAEIAQNEAAEQAASGAGAPETELTDSGQTLSGATEALPETHEKNVGKEILEQLEQSVQTGQKTLTFETANLEVGLHEVTSTENANETALISIAPTPPTRFRDTTAPKILAASLDTPNQITLSFSESLDTSRLSADSFELLSLSGTANPSITSFFYDKENQSVILWVQWFEPNVSYTLITHDIFDTLGNIMSVENNSQTFSLEQVKFFKNSHKEQPAESTNTSEQQTPEQTQQTAHETEQNITPSTQPREEQQSIETQIQTEPTF